MPSVGFVYLDIKPGREDEVLDEAISVPEVREAHLIPGEHDGLVVLKTEPEPVEPRVLRSIIMEKIAKIDGVLDTSTIIPLKSRFFPRDVSDETHARAFIFLEVKLGRDEEVMEKLGEMEEVTAAHVIPGQHDILALLAVRKEAVLDISEKVAEIIDNKIRRIRGVEDTLSLVPWKSLIKTWY